MELKKSLHGQKITPHLILIKYTSYCKDLYFQIRNPMQL